MSRSMSSNTLQAQTSRRSLSSVGTSSSKSQSTTFVIEIGTRLTRIGLAGEHTPRHVLRTQSTDPTRPSKIQVLYDPKRDPEEQERILTGFLKELIMGKMNKSPANSRFFIVDNLFLTSDFRDLCARVIFKSKSLEASAVSFVPGPLMNLVAMNVETALLLDTGINECLLYPIFQRVVVYQEFDATPCSTAAVERRVRQLMIQYGRVIGINGEERQINEADLKLFDDLNCAEDICYRFCFATTRKRSRAIARRFELPLSEFDIEDNIESGLSDTDAEDTAKIQLAPSIKLPFGSETLVVPGVVRESAADIVFKHDCRVPSIPQLIVDFIDRTSIEKKSLYLSNLMFVGGLSNMRGFLWRMKEELEFVLDFHAGGKYSKLKPHIKFHMLPTSVHSSASSEPTLDPSQPKEPSKSPESTPQSSQSFSPIRFSAAWIGASLISSFDYNTWFTKQEWSHDARVPDWNLDINVELENMKFEEIKIYKEQPKPMAC